MMTAAAGPEHHHIQWPLAVDPLSTMLPTSSAGPTMPTTSSSGIMAASSSGMNCTTSVSSSTVMRLGDLKRAVEDVILRPDQNPLHNMQNRDTIAALDLCQLEAVPSSCGVSPGAPSSSTSMNVCSCSSETMPENIHRESSQLCTSTSLDTIVNRPQPLFFRHSAGVSRRQSRVLAFPSKRKRSNSLTNYNKRQGMSVSLPPSARQTPLRFGEDSIYRSSLGSSESHSSVARSDDLSQDYMAEEDESITGQAFNYPPCGAVDTGTIAPTTSPASNPFMDFRNPNRDDEDMDCD